VTTVKGQIASLVTILLVLAGGVGVSFLKAAPATLPAGGGGVAVVALHQIAAEDMPGEPYVASVATLEQIVTQARARGYSFISLAEFHAYMEGRGKLPSRPVLLTFDDSYMDVYLLGHPVLAALKCPAVMFAITKWFSAYPRPESGLAHLTATESRDMLASGLWAFGGHTHDGHRSLPCRPGDEQRYFTTGRAWLLAEHRYETHDEYLARVWADLELMTLELARLGVAPVDFAPPYGSYNADLEEMLLAAGYRYIYVAGARLNHPGQTYVYRVDGGTSVEECLRNLDAVFQDAQD
jgi:biofilm PGA synthesis lipoprotein PgaB